MDLLFLTEQRQVAERVQAALQGLKAPQRETVERAYYQGQTREAIAAAMGVPVGTVKSRLKYALERLSGALSESDLHGEPAKSVGRARAGKAVKK